MKLFSKPIEKKVRSGAPSDHITNLMFDKESVGAATHPLARLLRLIFFRKKITLDDFSALYAQYGQRVGSSVYHTTTRCANARRALLDPDNLTYERFRRELYNILRLEVVEIAVTIRDEKTGQLITYKSTDPIE